MKKFIEKNFNLSKLVKSLLIIYLFFYRAIFNVIPIYLFNIDVNNISPKTLGYFNLYMGLAFGLVVYFVYYKDLLNELKTFIKKFWNNFDIGLKYWLIGLAIMFVSNLFLVLILRSGGSNNENAVQDLIKVCPIAMGFYSCLVAPFVEEIVFRKTLKDVIKNKGIFIIASFLFFGGAHVLSMAKNFVDLLYIIPYGALGATFAIAYYKTDTVFTSILFHIIHNSSLFFLSLLI